MAGKRSRLLDFDNPTPIQDNLFLHPNVSPEVDALWPPIYRNNEEETVKIIEQGEREGYLGLDFEFAKKGRITHIGVGCSDRCASVVWDEGLAKKVARVKAPAKFVGHFILDADKPKLEKMLGVTIPAERWESTEIRHYILNADFCSMPGKDEDDEDGTSLGLMNIWAMCGLYTSLPNWKFCRGSACVGPCPSGHDFLGYNAVDSYAPVVANHKMISEMQRLHIPEKLYENLRDLTLMCGAMSHKGIRVDRKYVAELEKKWDADKEAMFPFEMRRKGSKEIKVYGQYVGEEWVDLPFAPTAPKQAMAYFEAQGLALVGKGGKPMADKATVRKALEKALKKAGVEYEVSRFGGVELSDVEDTAKLSEPVQWLLRLDNHKSTGKGLDSWFAERYFVTPDGEKTKDSLHPRFITTGSALGRLSSSSPNGQNIPKAGMRALVRRAFVPRKGMQFVVADKAGLELRVVLAYSGIKLPPDLHDAFTWLVGKSEGCFEAAAKLAGRAEREVAKSVVHAADLLEGCKVLYDTDLRSPKVQKEIKEGALILYDGKDKPKWVCRGGIVGFTGGNLAERLFKSKTNEARRNALQIQEKYFAQFPQIRDWHRSLSKYVDRGWVQTRSGRYLELYGSAEDDLKLCAAMFMQGGGADEVQECMRRYWYRGQEHDVPLLQIHDELVHEVPADWDVDRILRFMEPFHEPSTIFDGMIFPVEISVGSSWFGGIKGVEKGDRRVIWEKGAKVQ